MIRFVTCMFLSCLFSSIAHAGDPPSCKGSFGPGEQIETRFMWIEVGLPMHILAEQYCGAKPLPIAPKFLAYLESHGCGPDTELYRGLADSLRKIEKADLKMMITGGNPAVKINDRQVREFAAHYAKELGGCKKLIKFHDSPFEAGK